MIIDYNSLVYSFQSYHCNHSFDRPFIDSMFTATLVVPISYMCTHAILHDDPIPNS